MQAWYAYIKTLIRDIERMIINKDMKTILKLKVQVKRNSNAQCN